MSIGLESSTHRRGKIFFGWWIVLVGCLFSLWGSLNLVDPHVISKLASNYQEQTLIGMGLIALPLILLLGIKAPLVGWLSDKHGPKILVMTGVFLTGSCLILIAWMNSPLSLYLVWYVLFPIGIYLSTGLPVEVAIVNWFIKKRGIALFLYGMVAELSAWNGRLPVGLIIQKIDWRLTCIVVGLSAWIIGLPLAWIFIKARRPEHYGLMPDGAALETKETEDIVEAASRYADEAGDIEMTAGQALTTRAFWLIVTASALSGAFYPAFHIHYIPFLADSGMELTTATKSAAIFAFSPLLSGILVAFIVDRTATSRIRFLPVAAFFMECIGIILFLLTQQSIAVLYLSSFLLGLGTGVAIVPITIMRARYFGRKNFGLITGLVVIIVGSMKPLSPLAAGIVYNLTGDHRIAFLPFAVLMGLAGLIMVYAAPPKNERPESSI